MKPIPGPAETGVKAIVLPVGAGAPKEPWQMRLEAAKEDIRKTMRPPNYEWRGMGKGRKQPWSYLSEPWNIAVRDAVIAGKPVPQEVRDDFERYTGTELPPFVEEAKPKPTADATLVDALQQAFERGRAPKDYNGLKKIVAEFDGKEPDQLRMKQGQEAYEAMLNRVASKIVT